MPNTATDELLTIGQAARRLGADSWQVRRLYERGLLPPARRAGRSRVVLASELPAVEKALRDACYLPVK